MTHSVLVTGAFGNIGRRAVAHLLKAGHRVVAADLRTPKTAAVAATFGNSLEVVWGNICEPDLWPRVLQGIDAVVHIAAVIPPGANLNPRLNTAVNLTATVELIKHMEASATAKRLIFASSMGVAGNEQHRRQPPLRTDEPPRPDDAYGEAKAESESHIRRSALNWSILRIAVCPPTEVSLKDVSGFDIMFESSATGRVEVVHSDDAGLAFANAVNCDEAIGKTLYVGGGARCQSQVLPFFNATLAATGMRPLRDDVLRPGPPYFYGDWLDTEESQRLLSYQRHGLDDILADMRASVGFMRLILRVFSPVISPLLARRSPHRRRV